jgi:hypothetical protein
MPAPTDDSVPDDFWTCLQGKDEVGCAKDAGCTWCMNKAGFGLCMSGPTAESAKNSDWFTCASDDGMMESSSDEPVKDLVDMSCILAYVQDQSKHGCTSIADADGKPCQWCAYPGAGNLCFNADQADAVASFGATCDAAVTEEVQDPFDMTCIMAFLQDQSESGCTSALDSDGNPCEWCSYPGMGNMCLNADQGEAGAAMGITCGTATIFAGLVAEK